MRYIKAFFTALRLTAQGQQIEPVEQRYPTLSQWITEGIRRCDAALRVADGNGLPHSARQELKLEVDSRPISMETVLGAVRHNLTLEYPMLLEASIEHNITTLYALNLDDQYRVSQLAQHEMLPAPVQKAVEELAEHLQAIPPSNQP